MINYDYDSFSRCHLRDIFFRFSRGSVTVKHGGHSQSSDVVRWSAIGESGQLR